MVCPEFHWIYLWIWSFSVRKRQVPPLSLLLTFPGPLEIIITCSSLDKIWSVVPSSLWARFLSQNGDWWLQTFWDLIIRWEAEAHVEISGCLF